VEETIETVIVGGGQAGLALSYHLRALGREHLILERGRVAERWRSERWDSLTFQFPSWSIELPGHAYRGMIPRALPRATRSSASSTRIASASRRRSGPA
jgi:putative flavoprotein involved in K+ transport